MFDEETLEKVTMELLSELEYETINGYELERDNYSNVILDQELENSIIRLNKGISDDEIREVIRLIKNLDNNNTILNNKQFTSYLLEGVKVPVTEDGATRYKTIRIIDFDNIDKNSFKAINQYTIVEESEKRPDIIIFINGMPLIVVELKSTIREDVKLEDGYRQLKYGSFISKWFGEVKPIKNDIYQAFAADSLMNNQLTMLKGPAGSGKTYLALGYLFQKLDKGAISKIIIFCNTVATRNSAKLGYYPGSRDEKLLDSQIGNLLVSKLGSRIEVERLVDEDKLVLLPLSDIRGYEAPEDSGVYISEAQNLDIDLMQLALTRIGDKAICVIDGDDTTQVDLPAYAGEYNGMKRVSQVYRGCDAYGEIELQIVHRGKIADLARKLKTLHY